MFTLLPICAAWLTYKPSSLNEKQSVGFPTKGTPQYFEGKSSTFWRYVQTCVATLLLVLASSQSVAAQTNGLNFDGTNDFVTAAHNAALNITTTISVEAWIKTSATDERYILTKNGSMIYMAINGGGAGAGKLTVYLDGATGAWTASNATVADGNWHHVAFTRNSSTLKIYVDGVLDKTATVNVANIATNTGALTIGMRSNAQYFNGSMDELRIWNTERTATEIVSNRSCEIATNATGLVAYYKFNEGTAAGTNTALTTTADATTNAITGTLTNFTKTGATSNWVTGTVNPIVTPSVSIASNPSGTIAVGTSVTFTATPTNGGTTPQYQWQKGGVNISGATAATYSSTTLVTNDVITCVLTSNATCATPTTATSNALTMTVNPAGAALSFDGTDDYVNVPHSASLNVSAVTIEAWLYWGATGTTTSFICGKGSEILEVQTAGVANGIRFIPTSGVYLDGTVNSVSSNTWVHLACVYDPSVGLAKMYVNGVSITLTKSGANPLTTAITQNTTSLNIGQRSGNSFRFTGRLDEFRIWNRALPQCEIQNNMFCELGATQTGLAAYYKFNQGAAAGTNTAVTTLTDASGNNNTGTLTNFALTGASSNWIQTGGVTTGTTCTVFAAPSVAIAASPGTSVNTNASVTFTATPTNGGTTPVYVWKKNGTAISGQTAAIYTVTTLVTGDIITCEMTNATCATAAISNALTMTVTNPCPSGTTLYVDASKTTSGNGTTWATAFKDLQAALTIARSCSNITQIWVAKGTYYPTATTDRTISFSMINNVSIIGGFAGTETALSQRVLKNNPTVLGGDIGTVGSNTDNTYIIFNNANLNATATLDGFTIAASNNTNGFNPQGGGMFNNGASPTLRNVVFAGNRAYNSVGSFDFFGQGAGMYNQSSSAPNLTNVVFVNNTSGLVGTMLTAAQHRLTFGERTVRR